MKYRLYVKNPAEAILYFGRFLASHHNKVILTFMNHQNTSVSSNHLIDLGSKDLFRSTNIDVGSINTQGIVISYCSELVNIESYRNTIVEYAKNVSNNNFTEINYSAASFSEKSYHLKRSMLNHIGFNREDILFKLSRYLYCENNLHESIIKKKQFITI